MVVLPENRVCLLLSAEPKDTTKPKIGRRKDLLIAASEGTLRIFSKAVSIQLAKLENKLRAHAYSCRGLSRGEFSIELGQRLTDSKL